MYKKNIHIFILPNYNLKYTNHSFNHDELRSKARAGCINFHDPDIEYHSIDTVDHFTGHVVDRCKMEDKTNKTQKVVEKFHPLEQAIPVTYF